MAANATNMDAMDAMISKMPFPASIGIATISLVTLLLIIPPMLWHFRNRNIGATSLIAWILVLLSFNVINAILWSSDHLQGSYNGIGLCDLEVKVEMGAEVALPASFACILRALAAVLDTDKATLTQTRTQRRRAYAIDLLCCVFFPALQMVLHYVVQENRYFINSISGCAATVSPTWLSFVVLYVPPTIFLVIDFYFAIIIIVRLSRYRYNFRAILVNSNTTRSRFLRLYLICIVAIVGDILLQSILAVFAYPRMHWPYSWNQAHNPTAWDEIKFFQSYGYVRPAVYIRIVYGLLVLCFFGLGKEAVAMYRSTLKSVGLGCCFSRRDGGGLKGASSLSDKARLLFKKKELFSTSSTLSTQGSLPPYGECSAPTGDGSQGQNVGKERQCSMSDKTLAKVSFTTTSEDFDIEIGLKDLGMEKVCEGMRPVTDI